MPVLGHGGSLVLQREAALPAVVVPSALDPESDTLVVVEPGLWTGDEVTMVCPRGLPLDSGTDGPDCPDGYAMYAAGPWLVGTNRAHVSSDSAPFYQGGTGSGGGENTSIYQWQWLSDSPLFFPTEGAGTDNNLHFYATAAASGQTTSRNLFIHRDQLDQIAFYSTKVEAMKGGQSGRIPLYNVDFGSLTLTAETSDWEVQGLLQSWTLNLTANEVDATAVGEKFGDAVKSIVTGGGSLDFYVDRQYIQGQTDATTLMRLLLLTEKGCKARAEFWMIEDRPESGIRLPGDLYYETEFLVTSTAINTRATEIIAGSLNFVTVGEIALQMGISTPDA